MNSNNFNNDAIFLLIILFSNIVQGITGFAGTVLAMPVSLFFVDINVSKPILNVVGMVSGLYVCLVSHRHIQYKVAAKILVLMLPGILMGFYALRLLKDYETVQLKILGIFVLLIGVYNMLKAKMNIPNKSMRPLIADCFLFLAGLFHGMFVTGGPLLVIFLTGVIKDKSEFRATISFIWVVLNTIIFIQHAITGCFTTSTALLTVYAVPAMLLSMLIGNKIHNRMNQKLFLDLTNILLVLSGTSLLLK